MMDEGKIRRCLRSSIRDEDAMNDQPARPSSTQVDPPGTVDEQEDRTVVAPPFRAPVRPAAAVPEATRGLPVVGQIVDDFELLQLLGSGSFARVFLARQVSLDRQVALKVSVNRGQEARTLASLEHDHIVRVFSEVVDPQHDLRLLCMQYVAGTTLEQVIAALSALPPDRRSGQALLDAVDRLASGPAAALDLAALRDRDLVGGLDLVETVCWLGARLAEALAHAHGLGVLHRDVKPANILVNCYGRPLLADFNLAVAARAGSAEQTFGGTLAYMAPEHLDAFNPTNWTPAAAVDARSDVYSLGVVLYEMYTGHLPFGTPPAGAFSVVLEQMAQERRAGAAPLSKFADAPAALERIIARCLAARPSERYQSAADLDADLESCRELRRAERDLPRGGLLTRLAVAQPFLMAALLLPLAHILGSIVNIAYNMFQIDLTEAQKDVFVPLVVCYNLAVYPLCVGLFFRQVLPVYRTWQQLGRPGQVDPAEVDEARRRALRLPLWGIGLSCLGWLPGGVIFPLVLHLAAWPVPPEVFLHYAISFTISGLIAMTYATIAVEFVVVRVLYPGLWLDARGLRATARSELAREEGRLAVLQFLAVLIPLFGAVLLLVVAPEKFHLTFRLLVTALLAAGMFGLGLAILAASAVRQAVDALTGTGRGTR
jgi:serine/threonine protein kinase